MKNFKARYIVAVLLIAITAATVRLLQYDSDYDDTAALEAINEIPLYIGTWKGNDVYLSENVYKILATKAIIHRAYSSEMGNEVFLSIVHYADAKVDFHTPEGCLGSGGIEAEKKIKTITISPSTGKQKIDIAEIITDKNGAKTLDYYFYKVGDFVGQNYIKTRMNIAVNKLTQGDSSASLIRTSTPITSGNSADAQAILINFLSDLFPVLERVL